MTLRDLAIELGTTTSDLADRLKEYWPSHPDNDAPLPGDAVAVLRSSHILRPIGPKGEEEYLAELAELAGRLQGTADLLQGPEGVMDAAAVTERGCCYIEIARLLHDRMSPGISPEASKLFQRLKGVMTLRTLLAEADDDPRACNVDAPAMMLASIIELLEADLVYLMPKKGPEMT